MRPLLAVKNLNVSLYNRPVLHDVNFEVMPHNIFALIGPSGSGKSTILRIICALISEQQNALIEGQILYKNKPIQPSHAPKMVIQTAQMLLGTVFDNLSQQFPKRSGLTHTQLREQITLFLCKLNLIELADSLDIEVLDLSKIERRKLLITNALLDNPTLIGLDDPTVDLDDAEAGELLDFICSLTEQHTIIMTTHNQLHARAVANVICLVADGRIQDCQLADEYFSNPKAPETPDSIIPNQASIKSLTEISDKLKTNNSQHITPDDFLNDLPEIEVWPLYDGPGTEPDFGSPQLVRPPGEINNSFIGGERPITLTSNPVHTESNDELPAVNETLSENDVFSNVEDLALNPEPGSSRWKIPWK